MYSIIARANFSRLCAMLVHAEFDSPLREESQNLQISLQNEIFCKTNLACYSRASKDSIHERNKIQKNRDTTSLDVDTFRPVSSIVFLAVWRHFERAKWKRFFSIWRILGDVPGIFIPFGIYTPSFGCVARYLYTLPHVGKGFQPVSLPNAHKSWTHTGLLFF